MGKAPAEFVSKFEGFHGMGGPVFINTLLAHGVSGVPPVFGTFAVETVRFGPGTATKCASSYLLRFYAEGDKNKTVQYEQFVQQKMLPAEVQQSGKFAALEVSGVMLMIRYFDGTFRAAVKAFGNKSIVTVVPHEVASFGME